MSGKLGREKKEQKEAQKAAEQKLWKRFQKYDWTPLNAPIKEVLMEIKRDPAYKRPSHILGRPPAKTAHKYCAYHDVNGHGTDTCIALRHLIEQFIARGKLARFLGEQRGQQNEPLDHRQRGRDRSDAPKYRAGHHHREERTRPREADRQENDRDRRERSRTVHGPQILKAISKSERSPGNLEYVMLYNI